MLKKITMHPQITQFIFKRILSVLTAIIMLMEFAFVPVAATHIDTASDWAREAVNTATANGYVPHDIQNNYKNVITRAEFCRMAVMYIEYVTGMSIDTVMTNKGVSRNPDAFTDTNDSYILAAYALGITNGTDAVKKLFTPNGQFSREQAATMIMNTCRTIGADVNSTYPSGFEDIDSASDWAVSGIEFCYANGIMNGTSSNPLLFSPKATYTREQSIMTFNNIDNSGIIEQQIGIIMVSGLAETQIKSVGNWAGVSSVQQFLYKNEGLSYAYVTDGQLKITTPEKTFSIEMKYPILGDVISDDDGNFYVVWGKSNETDNASAETTFISKYTASGKHVKTTGFVGASSPWGNDNAAKTKAPFQAGNSVSVIANGILINYHGKQRYDGHQCDQVIAVNISDMSVYNLPNNAYSGHSFNQSVIYCNKTSDFLFASHGDAYARGFRVNDSSGRYGDANEILFHFYMEANANYDMRIVNRTFAQLGGLAETSEGVVLVGASVKSISEAAKGEKQNLFVQIFNPLSNEVSSSMFVGGTDRSGATSFDINDNKNSPLESVTDYGVHWLTNYTDTDVVAPQVIEADDKIVIMWSTDDGNRATADDTFYIVLSASGEILIPTTSLGGIALNSFEKPVYHDGTVYWTAVSNGRLTVNTIDLNNHQ